MKDLYYTQHELTYTERLYHENQHTYSECSSSDYIEDIYSYQDYTKWLTDKPNNPPSEVNKLKEAIKLLTPKQQQILSGLLEGKKQQQIADELGVCQATVRHTMYGTKTQGGGIIKRLRTLITGRKCLECNQLIDTAYLAKDIRHKYCITHSRRRKR